MGFLMRIHHISLGCVANNYKLAPSLDDGQMMLRNLHYVLLQGFMLFDSSGLNKRFKKRSNIISLKEYLSIGIEFGTARRSM
jgi:hypothetical protein